jgi:peptidoglycan/xylan/chitin deacetylase (PgdA/CDA1 family)
MIRNFLFHQVNPTRNRLWDPIDVTLFEKCIKYITQKYEVVLMEDLVFSGSLQVKNKQATLMFDDGYKDNIEYAVPILDYYKCKASFYVVTDCIDFNQPTWTHILDHIFLYTGKTDIHVDFDFLPTGLRAKSLLSLEERVKYVTKLKPFLKTLSNACKNKVLDRVKETCSDVELPKLMMNWNDLKALKNSGHYIGSHTKTHSMLGTMTQEDDINNELLHSGNRIKEALGYFPMTISYPVGSYNDATKRLAKEAGYKIGLAVKQNVHSPAKEDCFEISRIELYNEPWWKTKLRITNALENIKTLIGYK